MKKFTDSLRIVFQIFVRDLKRVARNPIAVIVIAGVCLLPSLYAWYCIAANWDPYGNTGSVKVAVANEDAGVVSESVGNLSVGRQVVEGLKDNDQLGWVFVDEESALAGVDSGKYYAAIVIPENFSATFIDACKEGASRPQLDYYVNEKRSAVAPKVTDSGARAVKSSVDAQFTETVSKSLIELVQDKGSAVEEKAQQADDDLVTSIVHVNDAIGNTHTLLVDLGTTIDSSKQAACDAQGTLETFENSLPALSQSITDAQTLLGQARSVARDGEADFASHVTQGSIALGVASSQANTALGAVSGQIAQANGSVNASLQEATRLIAQNQAIIDELAAASTGNPAIQEVIADLKAQNASLQEVVDSLGTVSNELASTSEATARAAGVLNDAVQNTTTNIQQSVGAFQGSIVPQLTTSLDSCSLALGTLSGAVVSAGPTLEQTQGVLSQLQTTLDQAKQSNAAAALSLESMQSNIGVALSDVRALQTSASARELSAYLDMSPEELSSFMASPITLKTQVMNPVSTYGSSVAPFYTNLALWISGFILMAMVKLHVDPEGLPKFTVKQAYFGRWLFYVFIGLIQGCIVCVGDLVIGVQCENPIAFVCAGLLAEFAYVNLLYALAHAFRHIGKAIAVILLIVQIPGSSGMYPVEMMPSFFQAIHQFLPFTYAIDAMREAMGGFYGMHYQVDMAVLALVFVPLGFFVGLFIGRYGYNLNLMFDDKLGEADLLVAEEPPEHITRFRKRTLVRALLDTDDYRKSILSRTERFKSAYPRLVKLGWVAVFAQPVITFLVMSLVQADIDLKVILLMVMVVGIIIVDLYLIILSYFKADMDYQLSLSLLSDSELRGRARAQFVAGDREDAVQ